MPVQLEKFLESIRTCNSVNGLKNMLANAKRYGGLGPERKGEIEELIRARLFDVDPRAAVRIFPRPKEQAVAMLAEVWADAARKFDLSNNVHGQGGRVVRAGGDMTTGRAHLDWYISYRAPNGWVASMSWYQASPVEALFLRAGTYQFGRARNPSSYRLWDFSIVDQHKATELFFELLGDPSRCAAVRRA